MKAENMNPAVIETFQYYYAMDIYWKEARTISSS